MSNHSICLHSSKGLASQLMDLQRYKADLEKIGLIRIQTACAVFASASLPCSASLLNRSLALSCSRVSTCLSCCVSDDTSSPTLTVFAFIASCAIALMFALRYFPLAYLLHLLPYLVFGFQFTRHDVYALTNSICLINALSLTSFHVHWYCSCLQS